MAITRETKVQTNKVPAAYTAPAQVYVPSATALRNRNRTMDIAAATEVDANALTGFNNLLAQFDTDFAANVEPSLGWDATQTINVLLIIRNIERAPTVALLDDPDDNDAKYQSGTESFRITYDIYYEEVV